MQALDPAPISHTVQSDSSFDESVFIFGDPNAKVEAKKKAKEESASTYETVFFFGDPNAKAKEEAKMKAKEGSAATHDEPFFFLGEANAKAKEEAKRKAKEEADKTARKEAKEEAKRKAKEDADITARLEALSRNHFETQKITRKESDVKTGEDEERLASKEAGQLAVGNLAEIHGLVSKPEKNGLICKLISLNNLSGRWIVQIQNVDEEMSLKPQNLRVIVNAEMEAEEKADKIGQLTFACSEFKQLYEGSKLPREDLELLTALKTFLLTVCPLEGLKESDAEAFLRDLRKEAFGAGSAVAKRVDELLGSVPGYAQRLWTSVSTLQTENGRRELCWLINHAIRLDNPVLLKPLMPTIRAINSLCVVRGTREVTANVWPANGLCYRGGGLPEKARSFFRPGVQYRVPGFLATSLSEEIARRFAERAFDAGAGKLPVVLWTVQVDPEGSTDPQLRCKQVNYVTHSNLGNSEQEFLFAPYSTFTVTRTEWSDTPNYNTPHRIWLQAARDNLVEPEDLPLAPWY